jgi:hypothetical protein
MEAIGRSSCGNILLPWQRKSGLFDDDCVFLDIWLMFIAIKIVPPTKYGRTKHQLALSQT